MVEDPNLYIYYIGGASIEARIYLDYNGEINGTKLLLGKNIHRGE